ncbi:hypothetical protein HY78_00965 [Rhizorhabdus wittichii DC-6]|nr:hypothetical protein HY78_00965 [Rhizorhabdus wittichii DC-6]
MGAPSGEPTIMVKRTPDLDDISLGVNLSLDMLSVGVSNVTIGDEESRQYFSCIEGARVLLEQVRRDIDEMWRRSAH